MPSANASEQTAASGRRIGTVCVFCGSSSGHDPVYADAAKNLGRELASRKIGLIFGGGRVGLMGLLADSVLAGSGSAIGVMPKSLVEKEIAHTSLTKLHVVSSMHERKALMTHLAEAFLLLPGGFGSWEEFCEAFTWLQLGIHGKPAGILNVAGYYDSLLAQTSRAVFEGFLPAAHLDSLIVETDVGRLLSRLASAPVLREPKWLAKEER